MKIIKKKDLYTENRQDGRTINYYPPIDIPKNTKQIGFLKTTTPKDCNELLHKHPVSTEIFYYLTPAKVEVNGKVYDMESGDMIILEQGDKHRQVADNDIDLIALRIPLSKDKEIIKPK